MKISKLKISISLVLLIALPTVIFCLSGCEIFENHTDPVAGWKNFYPNPEPDAAITKDYEDYMHTLPPYPLIDPTRFFFEDEKGRHAVKIIVPSNGTEWTHVLIYDQNDKRIQIIKYISGHYAC